MKKLLTLALAATLALSSSVTAFAAPVDGSDYMTKDEIQETIDVITGGSGTLELNDVPIFDEDGKSVIDFTKSESIKTDEDFYVTSPYLALNSIFNDRDLFKVKFDKDENSDRFRYVLIVEKNFPELGNDMPAPVAPLYQSYQDDRIVAFRFILKETPSTDEFKISGEAVFTAREDIAVFDVTATNPTQPHIFLEATDRVLANPDNLPFKGIIKKGTKLVIPVKGYAKNAEVLADYDATAGDGGIVVKPTKNDDNEITWESENDTLVKLKFHADDDADKFYPKMSTKWYSVAPYTALFADQDAFIRNFMHNPVISSTSRATLELLNPFVNEDGEETIPAEDVIIYQVADGQLVDVTASFKAGTNDEDESVFTLKARQLGTYILAEKAIEMPKQ